MNPDSTSAVRGPLDSHRRILAATIVPALMLAATSCASAGPSAPIPDGSRRPVPDSQSRTGTESRIELRLDECVTVGECELTWVGVEDSRCPLGVTCVWEGEVRVTLEIACSGELASTVELGLRAGSSPAAVTVGRLGLRAVEVEPYPVSARKIEPNDLRAVVEVFESGASQVGEKS